MPRAPVDAGMKHCATCGKLMARRRYGKVLEGLKEFRRRRFCSLSCANTKALIKPKALHQCARKYREMVCEECNTTKKLHVHHKDENPSNNDLSNLQTLCASCHLRWHWRNGKTQPKRQSVCKVCSAPARKLDMCQKHYIRFRKYGDPCLSKRGNALGVFWVRETSPGVLSRC